MPLITQVTIAGNGQKEQGDVLYLPQAGNNLLGRDFQIPLKIGVIPNNGQMKVKIFILTQEDEQKIDPMVWAKSGNQGKMNIPPITIDLIPDSKPIRIPQYLLSMDGKKGLKPVIQELIQDGILEICKSPYNTPILAIRKPDNTYRFIQDLGEINKKVQAKYPFVENLYTLLNKVPPTCQK